MQPLRQVEGIALPFDGVNVDTDQIIPARFIMKPRDYDYSTLLFHDLRFGPKAEPDFPLDASAWRGAEILVTGPNFGCGSAREQAAYALIDFGIRALIGPSFGGIFFTNCIKNGILPATVDAADCASICAALESNPGSVLRIDLEEQVIVDPLGRRTPFLIGSSEKGQLLSGKDDIERTLEHEATIDAFEKARVQGATWSRPGTGEALKSTIRISVSKAAPDAV